MKRFLIVFIAVACFSTISVAQEKKSLNAIDSLATGIVLPPQISRRVFSTAPMPNVYQGDRCVPIPNGYRRSKDKSVQMPNAHSGVIIEPNLLDRANQKQLQEWHHERKATDTTEHTPPMQ